MKIKINENYYIDLDGNQYTPYWFKKGEGEMMVAGRKVNPEDRWISSGKYYNTLENAIKWVLDDTMVKGNDLDLGEYIETYRKTWEDIKAKAGV